MEGPFIVAAGQQYRDFDGGGNCGDQERYTFQVRA
jgi:hypothetical protein